MSGQIFISYRREDSAPWARLAYQSLAQRFPQSRIFMDVDNLPPGIDFVEAIEKSVSACDVQLVVIGTRWLMARDEKRRRRLDSPDDFVRLEIATALKRGIRVIPVLVDGASMPQSGELPEDLKPLIRRQALAVSHDRFRADSERLIGAVERALEDARVELQRKREEQERVEAERRQRAEEEPLQVEQRVLAERQEQERCQQEEQARLRAERQRRTEQERLEAKRQKAEARERLKAERRPKQAQEQLVADSDPGGKVMVHLLARRWWALALLGLLAVLFYIFGIFGLLTLWGRPVLASLYLILLCGAYAILGGIFNKGSDGHFASTLSSSSDWNPPYQERRFCI